MENEPIVGSRQNEGVPILKTIEIGGLKSFKVSLFKFKSQVRI